MARNPPWSRDELILALDLYFKIDPVHTTKANPEIVELSTILGALPIHPNRPDVVRFRNANGVYMKLCNFLRLDPSYTGTGLDAGSKMDEIVWDEFRTDRHRLEVLATAIRAQATSPNHFGSIAIVDEDVEAPEGQVLFRAHLVRERNQSLVRKKKQCAMVKNGALRCEVCDFNFTERYGTLGNGFTECHHTLPLSHLRPGQQTKVKDLALVCANCHRMLHRGGELLTIAALRERIQEIHAF